MELGYITFSAEEQQLVHNVLQRIEEGAIDELGLGRIRDAFSDMMFPGMSTLHRKSKYFVLLPTLYYQLAQLGITDRREIEEKIREWEINMTIGLLEGNKPIKEGITGSRRSIEELKDKQFVKIRPTHIYSSALKFFGLVSDKTSLTELIRLQSYTEVRKTKKREEEEQDDDSQTTGKEPVFTFFQGYDFSKTASISLHLNSIEAKALRERIIHKCREYNHGKDNLYSYILGNDQIHIVEDFFAMKKTIDGFPAELKKVYDLACDFSRWAHLMNTYYRYAFYQKTSAEDREDCCQYYRNYINGILSKHDYPSTKTLNEIIDYVSPSLDGVTELCNFCKKAGSYLGKKSKEEKLLDLIEKREKQIKGNHYKIGNERYKDTNFKTPPGYYSYRWNEIVYSMINDIRNPQS